MILVSTSRYHTIVVWTFGYATIAIRIFGYNKYSILKYGAILRKGAQHMSWGRSPSDLNPFEYNLNKDQLPSQLWLLLRAPVQVHAMGLWCHGLLQQGGFWCHQLVLCISPWRLSYCLSTLNIGRWSLQWTQCSYSGFDSCPFTCH
jgi:hypothetical protein